MRAVRQPLPLPRLTKIRPLPPGARMPMMSGKAIGAVTTIMSYEASTTAAPRLRRPHEIFAAARRSRQ